MIEAVYINVFGWHIVGVTVDDEEGDIVQSIGHFGVAGDIPHFGEALFAGFQVQGIQDCSSCAEVDIGAFEDQVIFLFATA